MTEIKKWYASKTLWVNFLALVGVFLNRQYGIQLTVEETTAVLAVVNMILRIATRQPLV